MEVRPLSGLATDAVAGAWDGAALVPGDSSWVVAKAMTGAKVVAGGGAGSVITLTWFVDVMVGLRVVITKEVEGSSMPTEVIVGVLVLRGPESWVLVKAVVSAAVTKESGVLSNVIVGVLVGVVVVVGTGALEREGRLPGDRRDGGGVAAGEVVSSIDLMKNAKGLTWVVV
jgi:hypothetical protein